MNRQIRIPSPRNPNSATRNSTGMMKRHRPYEKFDKKRDTKKHKPVKKAIVSSPPPEDREEEEDLSDAVVYRELTPYDQLLASLGSSHKLVAHMNKRRLRVEEEGKSEEEDSGSKDWKCYTDGEDDDVEGDDQENTTQEKDDNQGQEEESDAVEKDELSTNGQSSLDVSSPTSAFSEHLSHKLSSKELKKLPQGKWNFKWEAPAFGMPDCIWKGTRKNFFDGIQSDATYGLKPRLFNHWRQLYNNAGGRDFELSNRRRFFSICNSYLDILHSNKKPFYKGGLGEDASAMDAYLMHSLNHIFKSRDLVKKNDKFAKQATEEEILSDGGFLDQGFTRPKVLILLPMKSIAYRVVNRIIELTPESLRVNVEQPEWFRDDFGCGQGTVEGDNASKEKSSKPSDWQALFGEKNSDDSFMVPITHTRKSIRVCSDRYKSDMIVASPLYLHMEIGKAEENKEHNVDYLSSIEVLIIDHADIISMQNWSFLATVVDHLNKLPRKQHTNVMRIRPFYLDEHARFYRQTIILSSYLTPDINTLFNHQCLNYKGKMKLVCEYKGVRDQVLLPVQQIYERFDADSMSHVDDARLEYFTKKIFPKIKDSVQGGVLIFIQSYFELIRFYDGKQKIMLYTERMFFYKRYTISGIKKLIMYSLPERKEFYPEILNMLQGSHDLMCTVLFCRWDKLKSSRILHTRGGTLVPIWVRLLLLSCQKLDCIRVCVFFLFLFLFLFVEMVQIAKYKGFTTLVWVHAICEGAQLFITSLLNGVTATFEFFKYMPGLKIDIHGTPKTLARPQQVVMGNFTSPMGAVVGRMIKSIFPMVPPTPHGSRAVFVNCDDYILFKQFSSKGKSTKGRGLRFTLMLTSLQNKDFEWILETDLPVPEKPSLGKEDPSDGILRLLE